jgi:hypothetical protein
MSSLVLELQQEALNPKVALPDLLRKALVVARKLDIRDFKTWAENELNGYEDRDLIPNYRKIRGEAQCFNMVRGWVPIMFSERESEEYWTLWSCVESVSEIAVLAGQESGSSFIKASYSAEAAKALCNGIGVSTIPVRLIVPITKLARILDAVRNTILNWAMKLEEDHILGEGMTFTASEKETAKSTTYNITNFFAPVHSSQIQQQTAESTQVVAQVKVDTSDIRAFIEEIKANLHKLGLSSEAEGELNAEIGTLDAQVSSPKPKTSILHESLASVRRILEGASGTIAAQLLMRLGSIS